MKQVTVFFLVLVLVLAAAAGLYRLYDNTRSLSEEAAERFLTRWLTNENGTLATYIQEGGEEDEDEVRGREALAETLGLWMEYVYEKDDDERFDRAYSQFRRLFLAEDGFVYWKLEEDGTADVTSNALIDDIRIAGVLMKAAERWDNDYYEETAREILTFVENHNIYDGVLTDFYERRDKYAEDTITLSYIDAALLQDLAEADMLSAGPVAATGALLMDAPLSGPFYPKAYNVERGEYEYDEEVNILDQALAALHQAEAGTVSEPFLAFVETELEERGLMHGMYDLDTAEPVVSYESPAIYALLVMYAIEIGETELAETLYERMEAFQVTRRTSPYYGGYSIHDDNTHIFDNLLPMLARQQWEEQ
ncbi:glycosyl hydrolase [Salibacterium lacus]|uniref:Glycosyl hydrolase n=1 Tax=Salibacterium lacus TaxID=1898109 RepID=A0ABW5T286_9BACI